MRAWCQRATQMKPLLANRCIPSITETVSVQKQDLLAHTLEVTRFNLALSSQLATHKSTHLDTNTHHKLWVHHICAVYCCGNTGNPCKWCVGGSQRERRGTFKWALFTRSFQLKGPAREGAKWQPVKMVEKTGIKDPITHFLSLFVAG